MGTFDSVMLSRVDRQQQTFKAGSFEVSIYTRKNPHRETSNEDSIGYVCLNKNTIILIVADGVGGHPKGDDASHRVLETIIESVQNIEGFEKNENLIRNAVLNGIETANKKLVDDAAGAKTTVTVCEISGDLARSYQVGDSELIICGQKGKLKYKTTSHSPVGYGVEAGLITEKAALNHPDRHYISNVVGELEMKIEMGPRVKLAAKDTILLGSDGLFDNFSHKDLTDWVRIGSLDKVLKILETKLENKIKENVDNSDKAKYDDVSFLVVRAIPKKKAKAKPVKTKKSA